MTFQSRLVAGAPLRLRRDPVRFRVEPGVKEEVDVLWEVERARRSAPISDGALFSFVRLRNDVVWGQFVSYRYFIAQRLRPALRDRLGIYPVGVSGLLRLEWKKAIHYVFARRTGQVTQYAGCWELVPSGGIEAGVAASDGAVDFRRQLLRELREETSLRASEVKGLDLIGLVLDTSEGVFDVAFEIRVKTTPERFAKRFELGSQYGELRVVPAYEVAAFAGALGEELVPTSAAILRAKGLLNGRLG